MVISVASMQRGSEALLVWNCRAKTGRMTRGLNKELREVKPSWGDWAALQVPGADQGCTPVVQRQKQPEPPRHPQPVEPTTCTGEMQGSSGRWKPGQTWEPKTKQSFVLKQKHIRTLSGLFTDLSAESRGLTGSAYLSTTSGQSLAECSSRQIQDGYRELGFGIKNKKNRTAETLMDAHAEEADFTDSVQASY